MLLETQRQEATADLLFGRGEGSWAEAERLYRGILSARRSLQQQVSGHTSYNSTLQQQVSGHTSYSSTLPVHHTIVLCIVGRRGTAAGPDVNSRARPEEKIAVDRLARCYTCVD